MTTVTSTLAIALIATIATCGVFDVWCLYTGRPEDLMSSVLGRWSRQFPILPLAVGIALGHLFWPIADK